MAVQEIDEELLNGLKQAKSRRVYFALVLKGGTDGALLMGKQKVSPGDVADAKKKSGGSAVIKGACFVEDGKHIFEVAKTPGATWSVAAKTIAKRDAGLAIHAEFRQSNDPDLLEDGEAPPTSQTGPTQQSTQPQSNEQTQGGPLPETQKWEPALRTWEQASATSLASIDQLVSSLEASNDELALAISGIIQQAQADFPDTLDDALTGLVTAAKAGKAGEAEGFRNKSEIAIKAALAYLNNNAKTFDGCENNPFGVNVQIRAPLTAALKQVLIAVKK